VLDEVALVVVELVGPVHEVGVQVDLLGGPEAGLVLLVELQMSLCWMGKMTKRSLFSFSNGSLMDVA
jgi:hypothetical protein